MGAGLTARIRDRVSGDSARNSTRARKIKAIARREEGLDIGRWRIIGAPWRMRCSLLYPPSVPFRLISRVERGDEERPYDRGRGITLSRRWAAPCPSRTIGSV